MPRSLSEPEIQRYSRQILLREVGGVGQSALLGQTFALRGGGAALATCAAYVSGAGCPILPPERPVATDEVGFLFSAEDVGQPLVLKDAPATDPPQHGAAADEAEVALGELGQLPARFSSLGPRVALGSHSGRPALAWAGEGACPDCLNALLVMLEPAGAGDAVVLGSVGALVALRLVLGMEQSTGALVLTARGSEPLEGMRCSRCR